MGKYRKKPVVIEACPFDGTPEGMQRVMQELGDIPGANYVPLYPGGNQPLDYTRGIMIIPTLEGDHTASRGDWIIRGVKGEFYPCKPDIFWRTYEPVEE